eukprot:s712_g24.t1
MSETVATPLQLSGHLSQAEGLRLLGALSVFNSMATAVLQQPGPPPQGTGLLRVLRGALDRAMETPMPCSSGEGKSMSQMVPPSPTPSMARQERRISYEGELRFWKRLSGQGEYQEGSRLRLLRQDALTRHWTCFFVDLKAGPSKPRQYALTDNYSNYSTFCRFALLLSTTSDSEKCPLCLGREEKTEVLRVWPDGRLEEREGLPESEADKTKWLVRVLRNPFPYLLTPQDSPHGRAWCGVFWSLA